MVQHRNSDWKDSLVTLDRLKAIESRFGGHVWLVSAMNLHHLGRVKEAHAALRKAIEWMDNEERKAQEDVQFRLEYELIRPSLERLRQEARELIAREPKLGLKAPKSARLATRREHQARSTRDAGSFKKNDRRSTA
jgi:hypothetical protein